MTNHKAQTNPRHSNSITVLLTLGCISLLTACSSGSSKESSTSLTGAANPAPVSSSFAFTQTNYNAMPGGTVQLQIVGGTPPTTYSVVSGMGLIDSSSGLFTAPGSNGTTIVQAKDSTGLIANTDVTYSSSSSASGSLSIIVSANPIYTNSTVTLSASGGSGSYTFSKISGEGTISGNSFMTGADAGSVQLQVTDTNNAVGMAMLTVMAAGQLQLNPSSATVAPNNSFDFSASGGTGPYSFFVISGPGSFSGPSYLSPTAGTATIAVKDAVGHQVTGTITVGSGSTVTQTVLSQSLSILTDDQLGITMDNVNAQPYPVLVFFGTGSKFTDATYLDHTTEDTCKNGYNDVLSPCAVKIPLTNFDNANPGNTAYKGTMQFQGRSGSGNIQFCIDPSNRQQVLMVYNVATSFAQARYPNKDRVLLGGRLIQAAYTLVDANGGAGTVSITISNAGFTADASCGAPYTSGSVIQAFGN